MIRKIVRMYLVDWEETRYAFLKLGMLFGFVIGMLFLPLGKIEYIAFGFLVPALAFSILPSLLTRLFDLPQKAWKSVRRWALE